MKQDAPTVEDKREITPIEMAIITLATYLEDPSHDDYKVKEHILEILGLEDVNVLEI